MSVGSLKHVELTREVTELSDVPFLTFGQEIQSQRNLLRYYAVIDQLCGKAADIAEGKVMPLPNSSHVNILVDDPDLDFFVPKYITFPGSGELVKRFGTELLEVRLSIEKTFISLIKRIRSDLNIEGEANTVPSAKLGIGAGTDITVDPRDVKKFIETCAEALGVYKKDPMTKDQVIAKNHVYSYTIDLPYFRKAT